MLQKKKKTYVILAAVLIALGLYLFMTRQAMAPSDGAVSEECTAHKGTWLADYNECEYPDSKEWCEQTGGKFKECESACRHDKEATLCTLQCVVVCQF